MITTVETQIRVCRIEDREEANRLLYQESVIHADGVPDFFIPLEENFTEKTWEDTLNAADQVVLCAQREPGVLCGICHLIFYEASGWVHMKNAHVMNIVVDEVMVFLEAKELHLMLNQYQHPKKIFPLNQP